MFAPLTAHYIDTLSFVYVSSKLLDEFLNKQRITPSGGGLALAYMILPHINDISLQEMVRAHDCAWPGHFPKCIVPPKFANVGGGLSGLIASAELLRAGIEDITLFTSLDAILDDVSSLIPYGDNQHLVASFGVMPFPSNQTCLARYLSKFRSATDARIPIASENEAILYYHHKCHRYRRGQAPPTLFQQACALWKALLCEGCTQDGRKLRPPMKSHPFPTDGVYGRYVFRNSPKDSFTSVPSKLNAPGQDEYTWCLFYQLQNANCEEKDKRLYLVDSDYFFSRTWGEMVVQARINVACANVHSTNGKLSPFNPSDCLLNHYSS
ncbi:Cytokinin glycosidase [Parasponia andersonii]|uniref:Cytokinin glycosidase n=1 Tax=Parasponia andersonii TaxID=3476 RepID=A0A2P5AZ44_PARAD|nr:Cytokinin glycosidase [Parasponia andersonii]